jgi:predicted nucleotidyltransferase
MPGTDVSLRYSQPQAVSCPTGFTTPVPAILPTVTRRLANALRPEKIILFGSYAYGTPTPDSDVDLLVVMETSASPTERYLTVSRLLRPRPFPVDILVKTPDELSAALASGDFFLREIVSRGQVIYERDH